MKKASLFFLALLIISSSPVFSTKKQSFLLSDQSLSDVKGGDMNWACLGCLGMLILPFEFSWGGLFGVGAACAECIAEQGGGGGGGVCDPCPGGGGEEEAGLCQQLGGQIVGTSACGRNTVCCQE